ncbi:hypothetical protein G5C51_18235 [Streptomyces sp. A7024]|uniref:Lipoprotein n=1 Tax=Streptomyces coryli TaxID=1128680 RepID=A0A6G4U294_9ACTN|nr:hypothetical protein [Streptomyces coryli]NGN65826.1 hypothetical protein [Streptomyces coryli]
MRTALRRTAPAVLAIGALALTAACGGSADADDKDGAKATPSTAPAAKPLTQAQVEKALLATQDMPAGWSFDEETSSDNAGTGEFQAAVADKKQCQPLLDGIVGSDETPKPAESDVAVFVKGGADTAPAIVHGVTAFTEKQAADLMKTDISEVPAGCHTFNASDESLGDVKVTVSELAVPELADGSMGVRVLLDPAEADVYSVQYDMAVARVGGAIVNVAEISYTKDDQAAFEQAIKTAVAKAEKVTKAAAKAGSAA